MSLIWMTLAATEHFIDVTFNLMVTKWHVVDGLPQDLKIKMEQVSKKEYTLKMYH